MKLSSLIKSQKKSSFSSLLCRLPHCANPKTLSFRVENDHKIFNSQRFNNNVDDYMIEKVIEDLKIEKGRFFFEAREKNISILEVSSLVRSNNNNSSNELEFLPFNDSCVMTSMDSMDPYGKKTCSILERSSSTFSKSNNNNSSNELEFVPFNDSCVMTSMDSMDSYGEETSSILEGSSSTLSKSNNSSSSSNELEYLPFNDSCVMTSMDPYEEKTSSILEGSSPTLSKSTNDSTSSNKLKYLSFNDSCCIRLSSKEDDPYGDFMISMIRMIEANRKNKDWEECIEEIAYWYMETNEENFHKHIYGAFCDLWVIYSSTSRANIPRAFMNSPFSFSTNNPPSPHFLSLIESKAEKYNNDNSVIS